MKSICCLQGENLEKIQICSKKVFYIYWKLPKIILQNYIAIFSEEDPLYRTHNLEIGNIMFLVCDHVTAKYFLIQPWPCKNGDGSDDQYPTTTHSVDFCGNACQIRKFRIRRTFHFLDILGPAVE